MSDLVAGLRDFDQKKYDPRAIMEEAADKIEELYNRLGKSANARCEWERRANLAEEALERIKLADGDAVAMYEIARAALQTPPSNTL